MSEELKKYVSDLEKKYHALRKCVEFYADKKSWGNSGSQNMNRMRSNDCSIESFENEGFQYNKVNTGGRLARQTIKEIDAFQ